jgi:hypothetical protein
MRSPSRSDLLYKVPKAQSSVQYWTVLDVSVRWAGPQRARWRHPRRALGLGRMRHRLKTRGGDGVSSPQHAAHLCPHGAGGAGSDLPARGGHWARGRRRWAGVLVYLPRPSSTWWSQNTAKIRFLGQRAGGLAQLQGRKTAHVYHDTANSHAPLSLRLPGAAHCQRWACKWNTRHGYASTARCVAPGGDRRSSSAGGGAAGGVRAGVCLIPCDARGGHLPSGAGRVATVATDGDASHAPARRAYEKAGFTAHIPSVWLCRKL